MSEEPRVRPAHHSIHAPRRGRHVHQEAGSNRVRLSCSATTAAERLMTQIGRLRDINDFYDIHDIHDITIDLITAARQTVVIGTQ